MIDSSQVSIDSLVIHQIGSRSEGQPLRLSRNLFKLQDEDIVSSVLKNYFFNAFKTDAYYNFVTSTDLETNHINRLVTETFDNPASFYSNSLKVAEYLYEQSNHPKIKGGEFYMVLFRQCVVDGEVVDALGFFKSENKETFLKVYLKNDDFEIGAQDGINIRKMDKGCLVFNTEREGGYKICMVDNVNRGHEAHFWKDDFLGLQPREDSYYFTRNYMELCKDFVGQVYNHENSVPRTEQVDFLNRSFDFFDKKSNFSQDDFEREVTRMPEITEAFNDFRNQLEEEKAIPFNDSFDISQSAVKSEKKYFKSILKLDKNFHVYVHGRREYIEKGFDSQRGLHYYKLFFEQEA
ncbi:MAG: nucleoid-associated protein [Cytophagaceae bacterium]|jgi:hypothetical protein|nr:nucleoid-associated protein [Cytophagaceae bacterium]